MGKVKNLEMEMHEKIDACQEDLNRNLTEGEMRDLLKDNFMVDNHTIDQAVQNYLKHYKELEGI